MQVPQLGTTMPTLQEVFDYAKAHADYVSNSWGASEFSSEASYDSHFAQNGVSFFVSSGDAGLPAEYPSSSPNVISVGGTTLHGYMLLPQMDLLLDRLLRHRRVDADLPLHRPLPHLDFLFYHRDRRGRAPIPCSRLHAFLDRPRHLCLPPHLCAPWCHWRTVHFALGLEAGPPALPPLLGSLGEVYRIMMRQDRDGSIRHLIRGHHGDQHAATTYTLRIVVGVLLGDPHLGERVNESSSRSAAGTTQSGGQWTRDNNRANPRHGQGGGPHDQPTDTTQGRVNPNSLRSPTAAVVRGCGALSGGVVVRHENDIATHKLLIHEILHRTEGLCAFIK